MFVSVYESASGDSTPAWMGIMGGMLNMMGIQHHVVSNSTDRKVSHSETQSGVLKPLAPEVGVSTQEIVSKEGSRGERLLNADGDGKPPGRKACGSFGPSRG